MKIEDNVVTLSTGRTFNANLGLLSTTGERDDQLYEGYDGRSGPHPGVDEEDGGEPPFTTAERIEIAEFMIARWATWAGLGARRWRRF
jgi:hypothetical protein